MTFEERYKILLDETQLIWLVNYEFNKTRGTLKEWQKNYININQQMLRNQLIYAKLLKKFAPRKIFKILTEKIVNNLQRYMPISHICLSWVSEKEAILEIKDCPLLKRYKELIKQNHLDLDREFVCDNDLKIYPIMAKNLGIDLTYELKENGCQLVGKIK